MEIPLLGLALPLLLVSSLRFVMQSMLIAYIDNRICQELRDNTVVIKFTYAHGIDLGEQVMMEAKASGIQRAWIINCARCKKMKVLSLLEGNDFGRRDEVVNVARMARWVEPLYAGIWLCPECIKIVVAGIEADLQAGDGDNA